jgi:hypothetical protein
LSHTYILEVRAIEKEKVGTERAIAIYSGYIESMKRIRHFKYIDESFFDMELHLDKAMPYEEYVATMVNNKLLGGKLND